MKFQDERSGKLVVVVHCILNQNSRVSGLAHYPGVIDEVVGLLRKCNVGFVQTPCPELAYVGGERPSRTKEEYDTASYRKHCREIAVSTANQLEEFAKNDIEILAILGVKNSPSCDVGDSAAEKGILIEELASELEKKGLKVPMRSIDISAVASDVEWLKSVLGTG